MSSYRALLRARSIRESLLRVFIFIFPFAPFLLRPPPLYGVYVRTYTRRRDAIVHAVTRNKKKKKIM